MTASTSGDAGGNVSAALRINGELRSIPTDLPVDAVFPIYSITKTLTAICVLHLVERELLRLDEPAGQWLPDVHIPDTITLTHLLRHTSGLRDYGPLPEYHEAVRTRPHRPWTRQGFLDSVLPAGLLFAPGDRFSYSNVGYMLLTDIVERVTGLTFARVLNDVVTTPLALTRTTVLEQPDDLLRCVPGFGSEVTANGHVVDVRGRYHPGWCAPRLVASTAEDVTLVFEAFMTGRLLRADTVRQMLTLVPLSRKPEETIAVGMGMYSDRASRWGRNYAHGGGGPGYDLWATIYPDIQFGRVSIAVFVNSSRGPRAMEREVMLVEAVAQQLL
jgi:D-alanyl-D-alanine carboxypeptidase